MKIQVRKGIKIQPLSKYVTDEERSEYNAKLRNLGRKKVNRKKLIAFFNGTLMGDGSSKFYKMMKRPKYQKVCDRAFFGILGEEVKN